MEAKRIDLDAKSWTTVLDFYKTLFVKIGAPDWHGESVAALVDSMIYGGINHVEPPYTICVRGLTTLPSEVTDEVLTVKNAIEAARAERRTATGIDVPVAIEIA